VGSIKQNLRFPLAPHPPGSAYDIYIYHDINGFDSEGHVFIFK